MKKYLDEKTSWIKELEWDDGLGSGEDRKYVTKRDILISALPLLRKILDENNNEDYISAVNWTQDNIIEESLNYLEKLLNKNE